MSWLEVVKTAIDFFFLFIATAAGAAVAAWVAAHVGMRIWREQMLAKEEYELARKLLLAVLSMRDGIIRGRCASPINDEKEDVRCRIEKFGKANSDFEVGILEAEIMWGRMESMLHSFAFVKCCETYLISLSHFINNGSIGKSQVPIYGPLDDEFGKRLDAAVKQVQEWLKPKLELNHRVAAWWRKR